MASASPRATRLPESSSLQRLSASVSVQTTLSTDGPASVTGAVILPVKVKRKVPARTGASHMQDGAPEVLTLSAGPLLELEQVSVRSVRPGWSFSWMVKGHVCGTVRLTVAVYVTTAP